jgi:CBS domain-containing protein
MRCEELMQRDVHAVMPGDDTLMAASRMREFDVGLLPVCDGTGRVVGVVTARDLSSKVCAEDALATEKLVGDVMSPIAVTCRPTDSISHLERVMRIHHVTRVVVTDDDEKPVGLVSLFDIAFNDLEDAPSRHRTSVPRDRSAGSRRSRLM